MRKSILLFIILLFANKCQAKKQQNALLNDLLYTPNPYKVYFTYPERDENRTNKREAIERLLFLIQNSKFRIQIYAYTFNNTEIIEELERARNRGVEISFLLDKENDYSILKEKKFPYRIWTGNGLHHIKAIVFDSKTLFYGTGNFSRTGLTHSWNGFVELDLENSSEIISLLEMNSENLFWKEKDLQILFAPNQGIFIQNIILQNVENAKYSIKYMAFDHFDQILSHALKKASYRGVKVTGIYNSPVDKEGKYLLDEFSGIDSNIYKDGNANTIPATDGGYPEGGLLHHKTILIDDEVLLTGSFNFSVSARDFNREIFSITRNSFLVEQFRLEFNRILEHSYKQERNFHFSKYEIENIDSVDPLKICFTDFTEGIWEVRNSFFSFYGHYKPIGKQCLSFRDKQSSSSGLITQSQERVLQGTNLWTNARFYPRIGNKIFQTSGTESLISGIERGMFLEIQNYEITKEGKLLIRFKNPMPLFSQIILFAPGENLLSIPILRETNSEILTQDAIPPKYRNKFLVIFPQGNESLISCVAANSSAIQYILDLLQFQNQNKKILQCHKPN